MYKSVKTCNMQFMLHYWIILATKNQSIKQLLPLSQQQLYQQLDYFEVSCQSKFDIENTQKQGRKYFIKKKRSLK